MVSVLCSSTVGEIKIVGNYSKSDNHGLLDFTGISPENYVGYTSNDSTTTASIKKEIILMTHVNIKRY